MIKQNRLVFVFDDLLGGGAARVASLLGNAFDQRGWFVEMITTDEGKQNPVFHLNPGIIHIPLSVRSDADSFLLGLVLNINRIWVLRKALRRAKARVVVSLLDRINVLTLLAVSGLRVPIIVSERTDPTSRNIGRSWEILRRITYSWADALVFQGERPMQYFPQSICRRGHIIPNPVCKPLEDSRFRGYLKRARPERVVTALGSLRPEKGFDLLIKAFALVSDRHPLWSLIIWGEGPESDSLSALTIELGVADRVHLPGVTREPSIRLAESDLFILPSRVEGFPNALTEAMAVGLPVIASDVGAIPEIIRNGVDGAIYPRGDVPALATAMDRLMGDENERLRLGSKATEVLDRFSLDKVVTMWESLIYTVIGYRPSK